MVTLFVYLNTLSPGLGGETSFPLCKGVSRRVVPDEGTCEEDQPSPKEKTHLKVTPKQGDAVLFSNMDVHTGEMDPRVIHSGLPVVPGCKKFGLNIWIGEDSMMDYTQNTEGISLKRGALNKNSVSPLTGERLMEKYPDL